MGELVSREPKRAHLRDMCQHTSPTVVPEDVTTLMTTAPSMRFQSTLPLKFGLGGAMFLHVVCWVHTRDCRRQQSRHCHCTLGLQSIQFKSSIPLRISPAPRVARCCSEHASARHSQSNFDVCVVTCVWVTLND